MPDNIIQIQNLIYTIRGQKVMLDSDLAMLYEVETRVLNQAVKRNIERFPTDFMFQLTKDEFYNLKSQFVISRWGGIRKMPYVFTEQGVAMLSSVLKSKRAINMNVQIIRTFVAMRTWVLENKELTQRLSDLEHYFMEYAKSNNAEIDKINEAIKYLTDITKPSKVGFRE